MKTYSLIREESESLKVKVITMHRRIAFKVKVGKPYKFCRINTKINSLN